MKKAVLFAVFAAALAAYGFVFRGFYFTGDSLPTHDFSVAFVSGHITANHLLNGFLPLWSPEQNMGYPLWADTCVFPGWDPVSLAVNAVSFSLSLSSVAAHLVTVFIWHFIFALGGYFLFRRLGVSREAAFGGFALLLFCSLTALNFRQTDDYVTIYRYVPLLLLAAVGFFESPGIKSAALLGVMAGLGVCGYQTPNIAVVLACCAVAALPLRAGFTRCHAGFLVLAGVMAAAVASPFLVSAWFWVHNVPVARIANKDLGYRGGLMDILGPLAKVYPNETAIYIGTLPFAFALLGIIDLVKDRFGAARRKYFPAVFALVAALLIWVFYAGFPEHITGTGRAFLYIRSFNTMLPFVLLALVYFCCEYADGIKANFNAEPGPGFIAVLRQRPAARVILLAVSAGIFIEVARAYLLTSGFNRYHPLDFRISGGEIGRHALFLSGAHWVYFTVYAVSFAGLLAFWARRQWVGFMACALLFSVTELVSVNNTLLDAGLALPRARAEGVMTPALNQKLPQWPGARLENLDLWQQTPWRMQPNAVYHIFSAKTEERSTWFQTARYRRFIEGMTNRRNFLCLSGVTGPLAYFADKVVVKPEDEIIPYLNAAGIAELKNSFAAQAGLFPPELPLALPDARGEFAVEKYQPNSVVFKLSVKGPAYFVYADSYDSSWRAYLDGKRTPVIRANYNFKAVFVPVGGGHELEFVYRPYPFLAALALSAIGIAGAVIILLSRKAFACDAARHY